MMLAALAALAAVVVFVLVRRSRKGATEVVRESTPALDRWLRDALELELAESVLGLRDSTEHERKKLVRTLADEPDADIVSKIEEAVRAVELEFVRYAHEADFEATMRVRYEDGRIGTATRRFAPADVPEAVREELQSKGSTRAFRSWAFPWQRVRAL
jgi:hypothetical protein